MVGRCICSFWVKYAQNSSSQSPTTYLPVLVCLTGMAIVNDMTRDAIYMVISLSKGSAPASPYETPEKIVAGIVWQLKMQFGFMVLFWTTLWSIKASLMMFYRKLFSGLFGYMVWWWVMVGVCVATWLASILTNIFVCLPMSKRFSLVASGPSKRTNTQLARIFFWRSIRWLLSSCCARCNLFRNGKQLKLEHWLWILIWDIQSLDIGSDILLAILPIRLLVGLRIQRSKKIGVAGVFLLGIVIMVFALVRAVKILDAIRTVSPKGSVSVALWSMVESSVGTCWSSLAFASTFADHCVAIIVGSLPTLKGLITSKSRETGYDPTPKQRSRGGTNLAVESSRNSKGPHIRLYDLRSPGVMSTIQGGYESDEVLNHKHSKEGLGGITQTRVISVSSHPVRPGGSLDTLDQVVWYNMERKENRYHQYSSGVWDSHYTIDAGRVIDRHHKGVSEVRATISHGREKISKDRVQDPGDLRQETEY